MSSETSLQQPWQTNDLFLRALERQARPIEEKSRWYCSDLECDGLPHRGWEWKHARAKQHPPVGDWYIWLLLTGRGWGKTKTGAEWLADEIKKRPGLYWAVVGATSEDTKNTCMEGPAGLLAALGLDRYSSQYNATSGTLRLTDGTVVYSYSAERPDRLRGPNMSGVWCDELASWRYPDTWHDGVMMITRMIKPHIVITTTPRPSELIAELVKDSDVTVTRGPIWDNAANLAPETLRKLRDQYEGTRRGRQELEGELLTDVDGALWTIDMIDKCHQGPPEGGFSRVVVAVDPATTAGEDADETGIIVVAKGRDGHGYVLADRTCKYSPDGWAREVLKAYEEFSADRVVAEKNQGGDMVELTLRSVSPNIPYKGIVAKIGKRLRAEPVAALYEQNRIHHIETFKHLEDQLCTWTQASKKSPDRMDALVHGIAELGLTSFGGAKDWFEAQAPPCVKCGTPNPVGSSSCASCGCDLSPGTDAPPDKPFTPWEAPQPQAPPSRHIQDVMEAISTYGPNRGLPQMPEQPWRR